MGKPKRKILVFVVEENGRTLTQKSLHKLISELFDKALNEQNVEAIVANGATINDCAYLADQIVGRDISEWEIIYFHGSKYPPVLLAQEDKEALLVLLPDFTGASATAIYQVLVASGTYERFN